MIDHWVAYGAQNGLVYEDERRLPGRRINRPSLLLFLGALRGTIEGVPVAVRATSQGARVGTRVSGRSPHLTSLRVAVLLRKAASHDLDGPSADLAPLSTMLGTSFVVRSNDPSAASQLLTECVSEPLRTLADRNELAFLYDRGQLRLSWLDDAPANVATLDRALALVVASCRWKPMQVGYR